MKPLYKIKRGLDINLDGVAAKELQTLLPSNEYAVSPLDFTGITPRLTVKVGDYVMAGEALFVDKASERIKFVSPVSGEITAIERGERRKLLHVCVKASAQQENKDFGKLDAGKASREQFFHFYSVEVYR